MKRCTSEAEIRAALIALAPSLAKLLPPLPALPGKDGVPSVPNLVPVPAPPASTADPLSARGEGKGEAAPLHAEGGGTSSLSPRERAGGSVASNCMDWDESGLVAPKSDEGGSTPNHPPAACLSQTRRHEWEISQHLFAAARQRLFTLLVGAAPKTAFAEVARFADLASRLARRAAGTADVSEATSSATAALLAQFEEAIKQITSAEAEIPVPGKDGACPAVASERRRVPSVPNLKS